MGGHCLGLCCRYNLAFTAVLRSTYHLAPAQTLLTNHKTGAWRQLLLGTGSYATCVSLSLSWSEAVCYHANIPLLESRNDKWNCLLLRKSYQNSRDCNANEPYQGWDQGSMWLEVHLMLQHSGLQAPRRTRWSPRWERNWSFSHVGKAERAGTAQPREEKACTCYQHLYIPKGKV